VIRAAGYDFTVPELAEVRSLKLSDDESREIALSDEARAEIAGRRGCAWAHESEGRWGFTHEAEQRCLGRGAC